MHVGNRPSGLVRVAVGRFLCDAKQPLDKVNVGHIGFDILPACFHIAWIVAALAPGSLKALADAPRCGVRYEIDLNLVRGFDYYTKTAF